MNSEDVLVPATGSDGEMEVIEISVSVGDEIEHEQTIVVLESDKATVEVPSPKSGKVESVQVSVGDKVKEGDVLIKLVLSETNLSESKEKLEPEPGSEPEENPSMNNSASHAENKAETKAEGVRSEDTKETHAAPDSAMLSPKKETTERVSSEQTSSQETAFSAVSIHAGPSVRKFAREHGVDLSKVKPSGPRERILVEDVSGYIKAQVQRAQSGVVSSGYIGPSIAPLPDFKQFGEVSVSSMSKVHLKTAENMQRSSTVPHVTQFDEVDITEMESFRKAQKSAAEARSIKLTPIAFLLKACAYALKALPQFNVALDLAQQQIIQKHFIHIGFAVDTPHGLFVPVVRDVDKKSIWALAAECQELANKARDKKLKPAEMQGGCFTISSLGALGGTAFTPIINTPEVAILGVSKAQMKPVYTGQNNFEARLILPLSLSYDHRAVNGADGARFTTLLAKVMGDIRELLL
tara:strand:+ start:18782 stop:20179 length:1398 start_codon:yes stop_codon:yes gene_type:complete